MGQHLVLKRPLVLSLSPAAGGSLMKPNLQKLKILHRCKSCTGALHNGVEKGCLDTPQSED